MSFPKRSKLLKTKKFWVPLLPMAQALFSHKLHPKITPCIFMGYSPTQSTYYGYDHVSSKTYTSRHVIFIETEFPFSKLTSSSSASSTVNSDDWIPLSISLIHNTPSLPNNTSAETQTNNSQHTPPDSPISSVQSSPPNSLDNNNHHLLPK